MRTKILIGIGALAGLSAPAAALSPEDFKVTRTSELVKLCDVSADDPLYDSARGFCLGYLDAAWDYHQALTEKGMVFSGNSKDGRLVEFIELPELDFFLATQAHPELKSRMEEPAPLFYGFVKACMNGARQ